MIPYLTCVAAGELLEPFVDGELGVDDQVALESHLRWCAVCEARLEDMQLIGATMRLRHQNDTQAPGAVSDLATMRSSVLERVRAERDQSMPVRIRQMFSDARLLWTALGATASVLVCVGVASGVFNAATELERRDSLAGMIDMLANPGSDQNPRVLDGRVWCPSGEDACRTVLSQMSLPRALQPDLVLNGVTDEDVAFAVSAVVTREGRISNYELLLSERAGGRRRQGAASLDADAPAVLDAVRRSRFAPATDAQGPVAVSVVWLVTRTTVKAPAEVVRLKPVKQAVEGPADVVVRPPVEVPPGADLHLQAEDGPPSTSA